MRSQRYIISFFHSLLSRRFEEANKNDKLIPEHGTVQEARCCEIDTALIKWKCPFCKNADWMIYRGWATMTSTQSAINHRLLRTALEKMRRPRKKHKLWFLGTIITWIYYADCHITSVYESRIIYLRVISRKRSASRSLVDEEVASLFGNARNQTDIHPVKYDMRIMN